MKVRILLTGASGYLGQWLLHSFLTESDDNYAGNNNNEYHIYAIHHSNAGLKQAVEKFQSTIGANKNPRVTVQIDALDVGDPASVVAYLQQNPIDVCIHAAAISSPKACHDHPELAQSVNVPKHLFDAVLAQQHQQHNIAKKNIKMIALSTDQVYAGTDPPYKETDATIAPNLYGQTKVDMEKYLLSKLKQNQQQQAQIVLLRSSIMLGPVSPLAAYSSDDSLKARDTFLHFIESRKDKPTDFYTDEKRSVVAVTDVVRVIRWMVKSNNDDDNNNNILGAYNVGGPRAWSRFEMAEAVFLYLGYNSEAALIPIKKMELQPPPSIPMPLNTDMVIDKIRTLTGIEFMELDEMIKETFGAVSSSSSSNGQCNS